MAGQGLRVTCCGMSCRCRALCAHLPGCHEANELSTQQVHSGKILAAHCEHELELDIRIGLRNQVHGELSHQVDLKAVLVEHPCA